MREEGKKVWARRVCWEGEEVEQGGEREEEERDEGELRRS